MGDFPSQHREGSSDSAVGGSGGWVGGGVDGVSTLGLDAVGHSNNGAVDHPAERCFYCKGNLHECIQGLLNVTILLSQVWLSYFQNILE